MLPAKSSSECMIELLATRSQNRAAERGGDSYDKSYEESVRLHCQEESFRFVIKADNDES